MICQVCGTRFIASQGGGFFFDLLHCDVCGKGKRIAHQDLGDIHLGYVKGLPGPYAVARWKMDREIQERFEGPILTREEYVAAAEGTLERCSCGGTFRYGAPPRCPTCRSTGERWDRDPRVASAHYD